MVKTKRKTLSLLPAIQVRFPFFLSSLLFQYFLLRHSKTFQVHLNHHHQNHNDAAALYLIHRTTKQNIP